MAMPGRLEDHAMIGDLHTAALIDRDATIDWLCFPRFDSAACFAALLGNADNGFWRVAPSAGTPATRRSYRADSLVLEHEWDTPTGTVRLIDFMTPRDGAHDVIRIVEGVSGQVDVHSELRLRFDYGGALPWLRRHEDHVIAGAGPDGVVLRSNVPTYDADLTTYADATVRAGERVTFVFTWYPSHWEIPSPVDAITALETTDKFWSDWAARCQYRGPYRESVVRSLITLKALTFHPTGGIVAAPTTSLPEDIGGTRNWDYRYSWLRDSAFTLDALLRGGYLAEAQAWRDWLLRAVAGDPSSLQIMYAVDGARRIPEMQLDWLSGYENSGPVRIGNAAAEQLQIDVYGEVINTLYLARQSGLSLEPQAFDLQHRLLEHLESTWTEPDEGLWEIRAERRHFVHSKVLAWVAADRGVRLIEAAGPSTGDANRWRGLAEQIKADVLEHGYDPVRNTFTQSYGSDALDAALLIMPLVGFLPPDDHRIVGTVDAVLDDLTTADGLVLRYRAETDVDGLPGDEGAFLACSFWAVSALLTIGRRDQARQRFERLLALCNDVGLLAEEYDSRLGRMVGNFPQAMSHIPLVTAAFLLDPVG